MKYLIPMSMAVCIVISLDLIAGLALLVANY